MNILLFAGTVRLNVGHEGLTTHPSMGKKLIEEDDFEIDYAGWRASPPIHNPAAHRRALQIIGH